MYKKQIILTFFMALTFLLSSYKGNQEKEERKVYATYYDKGFRGKLTAMGTTYNPNELTCATRDRKIPFGTILEITNLANNKKVKVKVTNRMNLKARYELDLSTASFRSIGDLKTGRLRVNMKVVKIGDGKTHHKNKSIKK